MRKKELGTALGTFVCAGLILGLGYMGIVKSGERLLNNEEKPEKVTFEDNTSHVFYGEMEEDIQLFPWNYYNSGEEMRTENFIAEEEQKSLMENILQPMAAYNCKVDCEKVREAYLQRGGTIWENMKTCLIDQRFYMFYEDILEIEGRKYQIKAALDEGRLISFNCMEYREEEVQKTEEWKAGKKLLTEMLEKYADYIGGQVYDMNYPYHDEIMGEAYLFAYTDNMEKMNGLLQGKYSEEIYDVNFAEVKGRDSYSYQVIELKDRILLLIQGKYPIGLFYDPMSRSFCGYNYFLQW